MTKNFERALIQAEEYRSLSTSGRIAEANGVESTIDSLIGRLDANRNFVWPTEIAKTAGVSPIRRRRARWAK